MVFARALRPVLAVLAVASASACGNTSSYAPIIISIQALAPARQTGLFTTGIPTGTTSIVVTGLFLDSSTVVYVNGKPQKTTFAGNSTILVQDARTVNVDLDPAIAAVSQEVTVTAQGPDTLASAAVPLPILEAPAQVTNLTPRQVPPGSGDTTVTYTGTGFNSSARVVIDDTTPIPTTLVSPTQVTAVIAASFLQTAAFHALTLSEQQNCPFDCQGFSDREFFGVGP